MSVRWDKYGLHDEQCSCLRCESGYRPSAGERQRAREVWEAARKTLEALNKPLTKAELVRRARREEAVRLAREQQEKERRWHAEHPPLSKEQIRELDELKRREFPTLAGGLKR